MRKLRRERDEAMLKQSVHFQFSEEQARELVQGIANFKTAVENCATDCSNGYFKFKEAVRDLKKQFST
jgi:hypothetical protein